MPGFLLLKHSAKVLRTPPCRLTRQNLVVEPVTLATNSGELSLLTELSAQDSAAQKAGVHGCWGNVNNLCNSILFCLHSFSTNISQETWSLITRRVGKDIKLCTQTRLTMFIHSTSTLTFFGGGGHTTQPAEF